MFNLINFSKHSFSLTHYIDLFFYVHYLRTYLLVHTYLYINYQSNITTDFTCIPNQLFYSPLLTYYLFTSQDASLCMYLHAYLVPIKPLNHTHYT